MHSNLTIPVMINPPTVPCDPIEATAILDIKESCSSVVNSFVLKFGISVIGEFRSAEGVIGCCDICRKEKKPAKLRQPSTHVI